MSKIIRWGILGTGYVAREFARGLSFLADAELLAVGSRTSTSAQQFAREFKVPHWYQSYDELVSNKEIDIVYIATPANRHRDDSVLCLQAGKSVLCEKPFALNALQAKEIIDLARQQKLFCMEAMWMRFLPAIQKVKELIDSGTIGQIRMINADFGYLVKFDNNSRFFRPELGGGALLDFGVYCLSLAFLLLGNPAKIQSQAFIGKTGVDEQSAITLSYPQGELAILLATLQARTSNEAVIVGTKGKIRIHEPFCRPHQLSITPFSELVFSSNISSSLKQKLIALIQKNRLLQNLYFQLYSYVAPLILRKHKTIMQPFTGNGYNYEAAEVIRCLNAGQLESNIMPLNESLRIMEIMDEVRHHWQSL